jgi:hypothetical protein
MTALHPARIEADDVEPRPQLRRKLSPQDFVHPRRARPAGQQNQRPDLPRRVVGSISYHGDVDRRTTRIRPGDGHGHCRAVEFGLLRALRGVDQAMGMARALPSGSAHPWTLFGVANAEVTAVSVQVDMRRSGGALEAASVVDPDAVPSVDRRARLWLELSRAYGQQKDWIGTLGALKTATAASEESMRCHPLSRNLAAELVTHGGRIVEREARVLANRLGVTA